MQPILNIAIQAIRKSSHIVYNMYEILHNNKYNNIDYTSSNINKIYKKAEYLIVQTIQKFYPEHTIISIVNGTIINNKNNIEIAWIINPLNDITNFIKNIPHFSLSIAILFQKKTVVSVVYDPIRNELFTAIRGQGTYLNGYRLRSSNIRNLNNSIFAINLVKNFNNKNCNNFLSFIKKLFIYCKNLRCTGSITLDLAYIAAGRIDGLFKIGSSHNMWENSSGKLLIQEAGGIIKNFILLPENNNNHNISENFIAGNPNIINTILCNFNTEIQEKN